MIYYLYDNNLLIILIKFLVRNIFLKEKNLNNKLLKCAKKLNLKLREVICESTDAFYNFFPEHWMEVRDKHGVIKEGNFMAFIC